VDALVSDAIARAQQLPRRRIIPHRAPREARFIPLPLAAGLLLALAPPIPLPQGSLPNFSVSREEDEAKPKDRAGDLETSDRPKGRPRDIVQRAEMQERNLVPRMGAGGQNQPGDLSAIFKDTSLGGKAPDFNSFLKKGDERIRMLEQVDRLPDLQQDYTQRETKVIFQRAKSLRGGLDPSKVSPEKLRELLNEMERLGRKGSGSNNWSGDVYEGMEALEGGQTDKAMRPWNARSPRCARWATRGGTVRVFAGGARATAAADSAGAIGGRDKECPATRMTSPRAKASCRVAERARIRRGIPPSACAATPTTSAWKGSHGQGASKGSTPTWWGAAPTCRRACSILASWDSTGR